MGQPEIRVRYGLFLDQASEVPLAVRRAMEGSLKPPGILGHGVKIFRNLTGRALFSACFDDLRGQRNGRMRNPGPDHKKEGTPMAVARVDDVRGGFCQRNLLRSSHRYVFYFDMVGPRCGESTPHPVVLRTSEFQPSR